MAIINSGLTTPSTAYNNGKKITVDSNGIMYSCYSSTINSYSQISVMKSIDNGINWVNMNFTQITNYNQLCPVIAIDSNDLLHVVWFGKDSSNPTYSQIKYSNNISGTWSSWINVQPIIGYDQSYPNIAIDTNNKIHMVWHGNDSGNPNYVQIKYSNTISGVWSTWINIQPTSGYYQQNPSIAIDSNNKVHVVWCGNDSINTGTNQIKYSNNVSGAWSTWINIQTITGYHQQYPSIAIDSNNKVHMVWYGTDSSNIGTNYQIKYSNNTSGTFSMWVNIQTITGYNQYYPSIAIDGNNKLHVCWQGTDSGYGTYNQIKYSNNINGTWSTWINKTSLVAYSYPSIIYFNYKIYCVYNGSTTVELSIIPVYRYLYLLQDGNNILDVNPAYYGGTLPNTLTAISTITPTSSTFKTYGVKNINIPQATLNNLSNDAQILYWSDDPIIINPIIDKNVTFVKPYIATLSNPKVLGYTNDPTYIPSIMINGNKPSTYNYNVSLQNPALPSNPITQLKSISNCVDDISDSLVISRTLFQEAINPYNVTVSITEEDGTVIKNNNQITLYDTNPVLFLSMSGSILTVQTGDPEGDMVQIKILVNNKQVYPTNGTFSALQTPTSIFKYTFNQSQYDLNKSNIVTVIANDQYGLSSTLSTAFVGEYFGLMFLDESSQYYTTDLGKMLKYLNFGTMTLGQSTDVKKITMKNNFGFPITNIQLNANNKLPNINLGLSKSNNPFIDNDSIVFTDTYNTGDTDIFYVRLETTLSMQDSSGTFQITAKAQPK